MLKRELAKLHTGEARGRRGTVGRGESTGWGGAKALGGERQRPKHEVSEMTGLCSFFPSFKARFLSQHASQATRYRPGVEQGSGSRGYSQ